MKQSRHVKAKIAAGYLLIVAVCAASIAYVYRQMNRAWATDTTQIQLQMRRNVVGQTLYHLYQAESYGQLMLAGYRSYDKRYKDELATVRRHIDSLRMLPLPEADSLQDMRLDSIVLLLDEKQRRTMNFRRTMRAAGASTLLDESIREIIDGQRTDSLAAAVAGPRRALVREDTLRLGREKRGFFRRIADVFSPPKEDSSVVIATRVLVDSIPGSAVRDTIAGVLHNLQDEVAHRRIAIFDRARNEGDNLRYSNFLVNEKIYRLIRDFEQQEADLLTARIGRQEALKRRSSLVLGLIAMTAIVLMLGFVAVLWRDIGRSNRYKRRLEEADASNRMLLEAREKMMLAITHDIKAPLSGVMGYIDLLARMTPDRRSAHYLDRMRASSEHLLGLVNSLLDFYRLEADKVEPENVAFDPGGLLRGILDGFAPAAEARGLELAAALPESLRGEVCGDPLRIRQIAENLLSNALKFTDSGQVTLGAEMVGQRLVFYVRDTGRGIDPGQRERIFREFERLESAQGVAGFGLGLSIVDRLVRLLGGSIGVESPPGGGSKFIVSIPVRAAAPPSVQAPMRPTGLRCLLVDDDAFQLEMTEAMCRALGLQAASCPAPEYAARMVDEGRFDVVLCDIQMPKMNGFEVLDQIRHTRTGATLPVVAVSARSEREALYRKKGFAGLLRKPFSQSELYAAIRAALPERADRPAGGSLPSDACLPPGGIDRTGPRNDRAATDRQPRPGLDAITAFAHGDRQAEQQLLRSFVREQSANLRRLEAAAAAGEEQTVRGLCHKMRPLFALIGEHATALELAEAERAGEQTAGQEHAAALPARVGRIAENVRRVIAEAEKALTLYQTSNPA